MMTVLLLVTVITDQFRCLGYRDPSRGKPRNVITMANSTGTGVSVWNHACRMPVLVCSTASTTNEKGPEDPGTE